LLLHFDACVMRRGIRYSVLCTWDGDGDGETRLETRILLLDSNFPVVNYVKFSLPAVANGNDCQLKRNKKGQQRGGWRGGTVSWL